MPSVLDNDEQLQGLLARMFSKLVVTIDVKKKHVLFGKKRVYDQELVDPRVIVLLASLREINFDNVCRHTS